MTQSRILALGLLLLFPAIALALCVLAFNFLGDALRDYLDPRTRLTVGL